MPETTSLEKSTEIVGAHINFFHRVMDYVEGMISDPQAVAHDKCALGLWYFETAPGQSDRGPHPKFPELGACHMAFHLACEEAIRHRERGDVEAAKSAVLRAKELSRQVIGALTEILGL